MMLAVGLTYLALHLGSLLEFCRVILLRAEMTLSDVVVGRPGFVRPRNSKCAYGCRLRRGCRLKECVLAMTCRVCSMGDLRSAVITHVAIDVVNQVGSKGEDSSAGQLVIPAWLGSGKDIWVNVPVDRIDVEALEVSLESPALVARGSARLDLDQLRVVLAGADIVRGRDLSSCRGTGARWCWQNRASN